MTDLEKAARQKWHRKLKINSTYKFKVRGQDKEVKVKF